MRTTVTTQAELDAALADQNVDCIHIESPAGVWLTVRASGSAIVQASGSATVQAFGSAIVQAYDSATVQAFGSAIVHAYGSATVRASDSATVRASGSATVLAYGSAAVRASGSATVLAYGSATVQAYSSAAVQAYGSAAVLAYGSATVLAYDSAIVQAYGSATVRAYNSATVHAYSSATVQAYDSATVRASGSATVQADDSAIVQASGSTHVAARGSSTTTAGPHVAVHLHSGQATVTGGVLIDLTQLDLTDPATWCEHHDVQVVDGRVILYKCVDHHLIAGHDYMPTTYRLGGVVVAPDWRDDHECGGGLHLSPRPWQATIYQDAARRRWLRCTAALEDLRPISNDKAKVRALLVEAEVDESGRELPELAGVAG